MPKVTITPISSTISNTAANTINNNLNAIADAIENTVSRDGSIPNQMEADLDLNHNDLINVGLIDAQSLLINDVNIEEFIEQASASAESAAESAQDAIDAANRAEAHAATVVASTIPISLTFPDHASAGAAILPSTIQAVEVLGLDAPGDGGGGPGVIATSDPTPYPAIPNGSNWIHIKTEKLNLRQFGVRGSDYADTAVDETVGIHKALTAAAATGKVLVFPPAYFKAAEFRRTSAFKFYAEGESGGMPILLGTQEDADAGKYQLYFSRSSYDVDNTNPITQNIYPGDIVVRLTSTAGLSEGMILQWVSNKDYYYSEPGDVGTRDKCGEIHRITRIVSGTTVEIDGESNDFYDYLAETLTVRIWNPDEFKVHNIGFRVPYQVSGDPANETRGIFFDRCINPELDKLYFRGHSYVAVSDQRSWMCKANDLTFEDIGAGEDIGYCYQTRTNYGFHGTQFKSNGGRALIDFHTRSGDAGGPSRKFIFEDFHINGGNRDKNGVGYFPNSGDKQNRGVSTHGGAENGIIRNGHIANVQTGVRIRGRDMEVSGITFAGRMNECVQASQGTALKVTGNRYVRGDYPDKTNTPEMEAQRPTAFLRIGSTSPDSLWGWNSPVVVSNNSMDLISGFDGSTGGFIELQGGADIKNLFVHSNSIQTYVDTGEVLYLINSTNDGGGGCRLYSSHIDLNTNVIINHGPVGMMTFDPQIVLGPEEQGGLDAAVRLGGGRRLIRVRDDAVGVLRDVGKPGQVIVISLASSTGASTLSGSFAITPNNASLVSHGFIGSLIDGNASPDTMTGTTGTDGRVSIGLDASGNLYIENRTGFLRAFDVTVLAGSY